MISVVGGLLSSVVVLAIRLCVASQCARRRLDLDNVNTPIVTAAGDIATLPSLFPATYLLGFPCSRRWSRDLCAIGLHRALVAGLRSAAADPAPDHHRVGCRCSSSRASVDVLAGMTIEKRTESFLVFPALLVLMPPFLEDSGALGAILAARVSTRLHLGTLDRGRSPLAAADDVLLVLFYALPVFVLLGLSADLAAHVADLHSPGTLKMVAVSCSEGSWRPSSAVLVGFYAAVFTLPPWPRSRQLRHSDRDFDPGPVRRVLAYPCDRAPRASLAGAHILMDDQPRNLKAMLSEAKDTSELMVDLGYASLFFDDDDMADEVLELEERLDELVHEMRSVCVLAARSPRDAERCRVCCTSSRAIERIGNAAVDIANIVTHHLGIPARLVADLAAAEEISHRVRVREDSALAHRTLDDAELPTETGMRVVAIRRDKEWIIDPEDDEVLRARRRAVPAGRGRRHPELRVLAGAPEWRQPTLSRRHRVTDLDRAVDVLVEMKNVSEVAVGLAYSALLFNDQGLAAEVSHLENRLDEMRERLELWVLTRRGRDGRPVAVAGTAAPRWRRRGDRRRRAADGVARRGGRGDPPGPRRRRSATPTMSSCAYRWLPVPRSTERCSLPPVWVTTPASTSSRCTATAATSTGPAWERRSRPATSWSRRDRGKVARISRRRLVSG